MKLTDSDYIQKILIKHDIWITIDEIEEKYSENHRYYHTLRHINNLIDKITEIDINETEMNILLISAVFHDIIYIIGSKTNEIDSNNFFLSRCEDINYVTKNVSIIILDTIDHKPSNNLSKIFCELDMWTLKYGTYEELLEEEKYIKKEFNIFGYEKYKKGRINFLNKIINSEYGQNNKENLLKLIDYVKNKRVNESIDFDNEYNWDII